MESIKKPQAIVYREMAFLLVVLSAFVGLYFHVILEMAGVWQTNDNYSHGFFIPLISLYMIYGIRQNISRVPINPSNIGLLFIVIGLGQLYVASVGSEYFLQRTSIIIVLFGVSIFLWGFKVTQLLFLPIAYLVFMVPLPAIVWNKIAFPLQLFSSACTESVVRMFGIPIFREGNILHLAQTTLEVIDACSGLRSLNTMFALSAALAWFSTFAKWKKWILFLSAAPIAIFANIIRLTLTAFLASKYGEQAAQGFLHEFSGLFTFAFGLLLLIVTSRLLSISKPQILN